MLEGDKTRRNSAVKMVAANLARARNPQTLASARYHAVRHLIGRGSPSKEAQVWLAVPCSWVLVDDNLKARKKEGGAVPGPKLAHRPDVSRNPLRKGAYGHHLALVLKTEQTPLGALW